MLGATCGVSISLLDSSLQIFPCLVMGPSSSLPSDRKFVPWSQCLLSHLTLIFVCIWSCLLVALPFPSHCFVLNACKAWSSYLHASFLNHGSFALDSLFVCVYALYFPIASLYLLFYSCLLTFLVHTSLLGWKNICISAYTHILLHIHIFSHSFHDQLKVQVCEEPKWWAAARF